MITDLNQLSTSTGGGRVVEILVSGDKQKICFFSYTDVMYEILCTQCTSKQEVKSSNPTCGFFSQTL